MPKLSCSVTDCSHNAESCCCLNSIDVSGGATKENTCCSSFSGASTATNCSGTPTDTTGVTCKAHDCKHNNDCECHAEKVDVCSCGSACTCHDTQCGSYVKE